MASVDKYSKIVAAQQLGDKDHAHHGHFLRIIHISHLKYTGFVRVLENLESPGILFWHFPGLENPGKRPLVLESPGNLLNLTKNMKFMEGSKGN